MMSALDYIKIDGTDIYRPPKFTPQKEDIINGDYTTCTGKRLGDYVGWRYADMTLEWDALPQSMVSVLTDMTGTSTITFDNLDGVTVTENIIRTSVVAMRHRQTVAGGVLWRGVKVSIRFIDAHTENDDTEEEET